MSLVFLILGGNRGNTIEIFSAAIDLVTKHIGPKKSTSALYESESWGFKSDPFVNQVLIINTILSPSEVLSVIQDIEKQLGRIRQTDGYEARTIDIDILYYDSLIVSSDTLTIPHPRISERRFVLVPLAEIAPNFLDPVKGMTISEMLENCEDKLMVRRLG